MAENQAKNLLFLINSYIIFCDLNQRCPAMLDGDNNINSLQSEEIENQRTSTQIDADVFPKSSDFFWKYDAENSNIITDIITKDTILLWLVEELLKSIQPSKKILFKKNLQRCKTEEDVRAIIIENSKNWYKIGGREQSNNEILDGTKVWRKEELESVNDLAWEANENKDEYNNIKLENEEEQKVQNEELSKTDTRMNSYKELDNIKNVGNEKLIDLMKNNDGYKELLDALDERTKLVNEYKWLDKKTNKDSEQYLQVKQDLENSWALNQLRQKNYPEEYINDYILVTTTFRELNNNEENIYSKEDISFYSKLVKNLNNKLNIADTSIDSFSKENINATRKDLFNDEVWNKDLIEWKENNKYKHSEQYNEILWMESRDIILNYWKFLTSPEMKELLNNFIDWNDIWEKNYERLLNSANNIKIQVDEKTKDLVEELCLISQIKWMSICIWWDIKDNFEFNKANEIKNDDWILTIDWHINWVSFSLRQDTNNPEARLQTSTNLTKENPDQPNSPIIVWKNFRDSPFILPTQKDVFNIAKESIKPGLNKAETPQEYEKILQDNILQEVDKLYEDASLTHHYIENQAQWARVADKAIWFINQIKKSEIGWSITETNKYLYDFMRSLEFNIDNSTLEEKKDMLDAFDKIQKIVEEYWWNEKSPKQWMYHGVIENYLTNEEILQNTENSFKWNLVQWDSVLNLFKAYINNKDARSDGISYTIDFKALWNDLVPWSIPSLYAQKWDDDNYTKIKEQQDRDDAANLLQEIENL